MHGGSQVQACVVEQDALGSMRSNRTTIIVAHRLSTIMDANIIIVMKVLSFIYL